MAPRRKNERTSARPQLEYFLAEDACAFERGTRRALASARESRCNDERVLIMTKRHVLFLLRERCTTTVFSPRVSGTGCDTEPLC